MATKPKPKPDPEPEPEPDEETTDASDGVTLQERVENLENRMAAVEERQNAPPIRLGKRP
jgi:hypothetical protein